MHVETYILKNKVCYHTVPITESNAGAPVDTRNWEFSADILVPMMSGALLFVAFLKLLAMILIPNKWFLKLLNKYNKFREK
jgi:hypothetical protein